MRILMVTNMFPTPATPAEGVFIGEQVDSLRRRGNEVGVVHVVRTRDGFRSYAQLAPRLRAALADRPVDVVHVQYGGIMAAAAAGAVGDVPLVISYCGSDLRGEPTSPPVPRATAALGVLASRWAAPRADAIIVKWSGLRTSLPVCADDDRVQVVPNGVRTDLFRPGDRHSARVRLGWEGPGPHVMLAGQPRPIKRPWLAREAVDLLRRDHPGAVLHEPEGVARPAMVDWLNAADVVVLTSAHEGSPNVVKEALACEVPIVSVPVGDVPERLAGVPGCQLVDDDAATIAAGLGAALAAGRPRGGRRAVAPLGIAAVAERLEAVYDAAIRRHGGRR